jgi:mycoredoxin
MLTMYTTPWCGYCVRLKRQLDREGVEYEVVDIEREPSAEAYVKSVNDGNATVPTVVFPDGSVMTNPSIRQITDKVTSAA